MDAHTYVWLRTAWRGGYINLAQVRELRKAEPWSVLEADRERCRADFSTDLTVPGRCLLPAGHPGTIHEVGEDDGVPEPETNVWED